MNMILSREQYVRVLKLVWLGNWVINSCKTDHPVREFEDLEQYVFSFAKDEKLFEYIEYDPEDKKYYPSEKFQELPDVDRFIEEYNDFTFWQELASRFGERDFVSAYSEADREAMSQKEHFEKLYAIIEKYEKELAVNGLKHIQFVK